MTIVHDTIAAELAALVQTVKIPEPPHGYGRDLKCITSLSPMLEEVEGPAVVLQAVILRWTTARGTVADDPEFGENIRRYLNKGVTTAELASIQGRLINEAKKDDRVDTIDVEVTHTLTRITVKANITLKDVAGSFSLVLGITDAETLVELQAAA